MMSQTAEYALRASVYLAASDGPATVQDIARVTKVPAGYLSKVLQLLGRAGLVHSQRGIGGGFSLAVEPEKLTVLRIINAVDPVQRIVTCPLGLPSHGRNLCPLHRRLDDAAAAVEAVFGTTTLSNLLDDPSQSTPLCEIKAPGKRQKRPPSHQAPHK